jgi:hypothetical protein
MILKLIIFAVVAGFIYRLVGGKIPFIDKPASKKPEHEFGELEATSECATCGTYMTEDDALIYQRKAYCSTECVEKAKQLNK